MYNSIVMARTKKSVPKAVAEALPEPEPEVYSGVPVVEVSNLDTTGSVFGDLDEPTEEDIVLPMAEEIPPVDEGLTPDEKKIFVDLIKKYSTPEARAAVLAKLATFTDTKRAPVALRAIQEINALTGVSGNTSVEAPPMFALPKDSKVSIHVTKVVN